MRSFLPFRNLITSRMFEFLKIRASSILTCATALGLAITACKGPLPSHAGPAQRLPKIRIAKDGRTFVTDTGKPYVPFGVNYYRPGTGWAPQIWKQFDADATRNDFARMHGLGVNCVRVFLTFHSFYTDEGVLRPEGLAKFDQFLEIGSIRHLRASHR